MRWDDTEGLKPMSLERITRGVLGVLERTKTSGSGKHLKVLPIFVSADVWIETPWLDAGLALWLDPELGLYFKRDFFLPLPSPDFAAALKVRAHYTDALGFTRSLLGSLTTSLGTALLPQPAPYFWSEHSDRAGLDSWCATLGVGETERGFLGRWANKSSTDTYVRTACRVVENLQRLACTHARKSFKGGPDYFGEEHVLLDLKKFLLAKGMDEGTAAVTVASLTVADASLDPTAEGDFRAAVLAPLPALADAGSDSGDEAADAGTNWDLFGGGEAPTEAIQDAAGPDGQPLEEKILVAEAASRAPVPVPIRGFVVSRTKRVKHRKLHAVQLCWRVPGTHYKEWKDFGEMLPAEAEFDSVCSTCLPSGPLAPEELDAVSSGSSSSSSDEEPKSKKAKADEDSDE